LQTFFAERTLQQHADASKGQEGLPRDGGFETRPYKSSNL
jgi:hypothetical protein